MNYSYRWKLADANFSKDKGKVFSCFACTGGSTMGYKLAGFDVIGFNEIDMRMGEVYVRNHKPVSTLVASEGSKMTLYEEPRRMNIKEMILAQSFPEDFDFLTVSATKIQYMLGMSVPPVMMARIASEIREQWKEIF
ncbi:MAG: DNA cytosine methyltransferase [Mangrovibacterium sp.]